MCRSCHFVKQRLDRIVPNPDWILKFSKVKVSHLLRTRSDHCPLLLSLAHKPSENYNRPFRLETMCLKHLNFNNVVAHTWKSRMNNQQNANTIFRKRVTEWNKCMFGNIFTRKKKSFAMLESTKFCIIINANPLLFRSLDCKASV